MSRMSLQQTKTYNKEKSLAKQANDEASRNAAEAQKKRVLPKGLMRLEQKVSQNSQSQMALMIKVIDIQCMRQPSLVNSPLVLCPICMT